MEIPIPEKEADLYIETELKMTYLLGFYYWILQKK